MTMHNPNDAACHPPGHRRPLLLVVSAPSGGGKTTLCRRLLAASTRMRYSISCTTRPPRGQEADGRDYYFLTPAQFAERVTKGDFLEHACVHGYQYGTPRSAIEAALDAGFDIVLDIDVQGARCLRATIARLPADHGLRRAYVDVFIEPPSWEILEKRLRNRGEDPQDVVQRRLQNARAELAAGNCYAYRIVNDDLDEATVALRSIVIAEHHRNLDRKEEG